MLCHIVAPLRRDNFPMPGAVRALSTCPLQKVSPQGSQQVGGTFFHRLVDTDANIGLAFMAQRENTRIYRRPDNAVFQLIHRELHPLQIVSGGKILDFFVRIKAIRVFLRLIQYVWQTGFGSCQGCFCIRVIVRSHLIVHIVRFFLATA